MGRVVTPLSDAKIKRLKPREKLYRVSDGNGLVLEVKPTGTKVWRVRYIFEGRAKTYTIGEYPLISLAYARREAMEVKQKVLRGIDSVEERRAKERKSK